MKKIVITGASGFVGGVLIKKLLDSNYQVVAITHKTKMLHIDSPYFDYIDINKAISGNTSALKDAYAMVHLAAKTHSNLSSNQQNIDEYQKINVELTRKVCNLSITNKIVKFIYLSSIKVNGEKSSIDGFTEKDIPNPEDLYGQSKLDAELLVEELCTGQAMDYLIIRSPLIYGKSVKGNLQLLSRFIDISLPLPINSIDNKRSILFIDNLVDAIMTCIKSNQFKNSLYLVSDNQPISTPDLVKKIAKARNKKVFLFSFPLLLLKMLLTLIGQKSKYERLTNNLRINNSRFKEDFGWSPPFESNSSIEESFK